MKKAILATKVGMTQIFNEDGMLIPVTVLQAGPLDWPCLLMAPWKPLPLETAVASI